MQRTSSTMSTLLSLLKYVPLVIIPCVFKSVFFPHSLLDCLLYFISIPLSRVLLVSCVSACVPGVSFVFFFVFLHSWIHFACIDYRFGFIKAPFLFINLQASVSCNVVLHSIIHNSLARCVQYRSVRLKNSKISDIIITTCLTNSNQTMSF